MKRLILIAVLLCVGCQSNQPPVTRKPDCDGEQCKRQTTPNDVIKKKPLVYY